VWERGDWVKKIHNLLEPLVKECGNKVKETRFVRSSSMETKEKERV